MHQPPLPWASQEQLLRQVLQQQGLLHQQQELIHINSKIIND
jgi:hypothetical protein